MDLEVQWFRDGRRLDINVPNAEITSDGALFNNFLAGTA